MSTSYDEPKQPNAGIGDIVKVAGYGDNLYRIDSVNYELYRDAEVEHDGIFYETTHVSTLNTLLADDEDITVVSRSEHSKKYLRKHIAKPKPRAPLPTVDDLLDDLRSALLVVDIFGDHEDDAKRDRKYALRVCEIKAKLRERTEGWK